MHLLKHLRDVRTLAAPRPTPDPLARTPLAGERQPFLSSLSASFLGIQTEDAANLQS